MRDERTVVRQQIREAIEARKLPSHAPTRLWAGSGTGAPCALCDRPVGRNEVEYELEFFSDEGRLAARNPRVHVKCFLAWRDATQDLEAATKVNERGLPIAGDDGSIQRGERPTTSTQGSS
jgi:hypothetical protein